MHDKLLNNLAQCIEEENALDWIAKGRAVLTQKDKVMLLVITGLLPAYH